MNTRPDPDQVPPVRTVSRDVVYQSAKFAVVRDVQELPDGARNTWESVVFGGSALILPIDREGYVYLVDQYRPILGRYSLEIVGGRLDGDEPPIEAARRELLEETGIQARLIYLGTPELSTAAVRCQEHFFLAVVESIGTAELEEFERQTFRPFQRIPLEEAVERVMRREVVDLATIALVLLAVEHRRRYGLEPAPDDWGAR